MTLLKATSGRELPPRSAAEMSIKDVPPGYDPFVFYYLTNLNQVTGVREGI